jgi:GH15 family glucan-1,4-alpha-glucosidase
MVSLDMTHSSSDGGSRPGPRGRTPQRRDGYLPVEDYGAIGDGSTLALVGLDGAIDWMCLPQLDSPSVFGAILDPERGGRFVLAPAVSFTAEHRYVERTNVLETTFHTAEGDVRVTDALSIDSAGTAPWRELMRKVEGLSGTVPMRWRLDPRPDYGRASPAFERRGSALVARHSGLQLALVTWEAGEAELTSGSAFGSFAVEEGAQAMLTLAATDREPLPIPERDAVERRLEETLHAWRTWVSRHSYSGPWQEAVERSLLAIKLLADSRTGAITAAGTTSLPEVVGGKRNFDYRFGWVRDLCFTLDALLAVDMQELVQASVAWLFAATANTHPRIDPVYALTGAVVRGQKELPLSGYLRTSPVHLGNNAGSQLQLGGFGDLIETISRYTACGHLLSPAAGERLADVGDLLTRLWRNQDSGLWELGSLADYGTSKLGVWVAFDRLLDLAEQGHVPARSTQRWQRARDEVQEYIETRLFSETKGSYRFRADSDELDCGMLLAGRRRFGDVSGPRMNGTIDAIKRELHAEGPLFYRYSGMQDEENAFLACSFWMVEAMAVSGRLEEAAELMHDAIGVGSDLGLYTEEMEPGSRVMRGNFPQALTHLSLINAAVALEGAHTSTERTGAATLLQSGGSPSST